VEAYHADDGGSQTARVARSVALSAGAVTGETSRSFPRKYCANDPSGLAR
tara:strand:+ start:386 stop:535 length:150 start_codon:yes stop_codon:yes gene_type:complete